MARRGRRRKFTGINANVQVDSKITDAWAAKILSADIGKVIDDTVYEVTRDAANKMARLSPVDTGRLKRTLWASRSIEKIADGHYTIRNLTEYGIRQNFEHRTKAGFITNPANEAESQVNAKVIEELRRIFD